MKGGATRSNARCLALWVALALLATVPAGAADVRYAGLSGKMPGVRPPAIP
ncbi:hypothetical protein K0B90_10635 [bacterium]|nr:hypothetical protein [bacterium]